MKIALAQINPAIADLSGNVERCLNAIIASRIYDSLAYTSPSRKAPTLAKWPP